MLWSTRRKEAVEPRSPMVQRKNSAGVKGALVCLNLGCGSRVTLEAID